MNQNDLISVIVPVFNVDKYLPQCLDSILASSYKNLEIICIDDASTDHSRAILQQYAKKDDRILLIHCQRNEGQSSARNKGLEIAKGSFLSFVDSDDYVSPMFFETLYKGLIMNACDVSVCGYYEVNDITGNQKEEKFVSANILSEKEWWELYQYKHSVIMNSVCNKMFRRECFDGIRFNTGKKYEDTEIQHKILHEKKLFVTSDCLYYYRKRAGSTTSSQKHNLSSFDRIDALICRAEYFSDKRWITEKCLALQDAIHTLYYAIFKTDLDINDAKRIGEKHSKRIKELMGIREWLTIDQKFRCFMILYMPNSFHYIRKTIKSDEYRDKGN